MYTAITIAENILDYCHANDIPMNNLKLQKILYFLQVQFLHQFKKPCFSDPIEAWGFGPAVPSVFHAFSIFGSASIPKDFRKDRMYWTNQVGTVDDQHKPIINMVIENLRSYSVSELTRLSMNQQPWKLVYYSGARAATIPIELIQAYLPK